MARLKSELWISAFVRRLNDRGDFCVIARKGDPDAGQIWIEIDHLNGQFSLFAPAPANPDAVGREFVCRLDHAEISAIKDRLDKEANFDPDFWVISVETRGDDLGLTVVE